MICCTLICFKRLTCFIQIKFFYLRYYSSIWSILSVCIKGRLFYSSSDSYPTSLCSISPSVCHLMLVHAFITFIRVIDVTTTTHTDTGLHNKVDQIFHSRRKNRHAPIFSFKKKNQYSSYLFIPENWMIRPSLKAKWQTNRLYFYQ